jgi:hypothetical protein
MYTRIRRMRTCTTVPLVTPRSLFKTCAHGLRESPTLGGLGVYGWGCWRVVAVGHRDRGVMGLVEHGNIATTGYRALTTSRPSSGCMPPSKRWSSASVSAAPAVPSRYDSHTGLRVSSRTARQRPASSTWSRRLFQAARTVAKVSGRLAPHVLISEGVRSASLLPTVPAPGCWNLGCWRLGEVILRIRQRLWRVRITDHP